jgi:uncharacterized membrane protein YeiH
LLLLLFLLHQVFFIASFVSAIFIFIAARLFVISHRLFLIPDAAGLAMFAIAGTLASLMMGVPWLIALYFKINLPVFRFK